MSSTGRRRGPSTENIDRAQLKQRIRDWLDSNPDGTEDALVADLTPLYPEHAPEDVATIVGNVLFAEVRERQR